MKWIAENAPTIYAGLAVVGVSSMVNIKDGKLKKYTITSSIVGGIVGFIGRTSCVILQPQL